MTKQEEIREGMDLILDNLIEGNKIRINTEGMVALYRGKILTYLHSQGVVIKVDRIPQCGESNLDANTAMSYKLIKKAGYVAVEPLIEE